MFASLCAGLYYFDVAATAHRAGDRPLFLYGPEQQARGSGPAVLPRLDKAWFDVSIAANYLTSNSQLSLQCTSTQCSQSVPVVAETVPLCLLLHFGYSYCDCAISYYVKPAQHSCALHTYTHSHS